MEKKISIILLTYNSSLYKTFLTIESILRQNFDDFELIVSDDGSLQNNYDEIENFFKYMGVSTYKFVNNSVNQGTVKNFLSALKVAEGKYIRGMSPGDLFYTDKSLSYIYEGMEKYNGKIGFGKFQSYSFDVAEEKIQLKHYIWPKNKFIYSKEFRYVDMTPYIFSGDSISGASLFYRKDFLEEILFEFKDKVIYTEDLSRILAIIKREKFVAINKVLFWYEYGQGISTNGNKEWKKKIQQDYENFNVLLTEKYGECQTAQKYLDIQKIIAIKNAWKRRIKLCFKEPGIFFVKVCMYFIPVINKCDINENAFLYDENFIKYIKSITRNIE